MAPAPGASEKEQGNVHFKAGRYAQAVGAYSAAIAADRQNSTYLLNRSQAYLKLSKWEDALRDASSCLTLDPKSTKALFRRAAAHKGLERFVEALNDLKKAKSLDGRNPEIDAEISAVQSLLEKQVQQEQARKAKREALVRRNLESTQETQPYPSPQGSSTALAKVRESLKEPSSKGNEDNMIKAVSTRRFDNSSAPLQSASAPVAQNSHPVSQALSKPMTFAEAKQARAQRLGGQQPRHSTAASTAVQSSLDKATAPSPEHALSSPKLQSASIKSAYEFTRAWREAAGCSTQSLQEARRDILKRVTPSDLPTVLGSSLEPELLSEIVQCCHASKDTPFANTSQELLTVMPNVQRFDFISLLLDDQDRSKAVDVLKAGQADAASIAAWS